MAHEWGVTGFVYRVIATRVVTPVSKLVNPQHVQPINLKGHGPSGKQRQGNAKNKVGKGRLNGG